MTRHRLGWLLAGLVLGLIVGSAFRLLPAQAGSGRGVCPPDAVRVGTTCIDLYEASLWQTANAGLIQRIRAGTVTLNDLTAAGAIQVTTTSVAAAGCPANGTGCVEVYAVSIPGVLPAQGLTWFQAVAAARNSDKRLPTNAEWQAAALGTPSGAPCIVAAAAPGPTGTAGCVSDAGLFDMVGNVEELVAEWAVGGVCQVLPIFGVNDLNCIGAELGILGSNGATSLRRGGAYTFGNQAGVFAVDARVAVSEEALSLGFRAVR